MAWLHEEAAQWEYVRMAWEMLCAPLSSQEVQAGNILEVLAARMHKDREYPIKTPYDLLPDTEQNVYRQKAWKVVKDVYFLFHHHPYTLYTGRRRHCTSCVRPEITK